MRNQVDFAQKTLLENTKIQYGIFGASLSF